MAGIMIDALKELEGKIFLDHDVKDWSKIKYEVRCNWGVKVNYEYPAPVIHDYYFESFSDMEKFVQWYMIDNTSLGKKIYWVREAGRFLNITIKEVASKVEVSR